MKIGDIIAVSGISFLAKSIKFFQRIYMKREKIKSKAVFNHAGIIVIREGQFKVAEMTIKDNKVALFVQPYKDVYEGKRNHLILTPKKPFTDSQIGRIEAKILEYEDRSLRYGFFDIALQIVYSLTGKWLRKNGNSKRQICTELVANAVNSALPGCFQHPESTNPMEIFLCNKYEIDKQFIKQWEEMK